MNRHGPPATSLFLVNKSKCIYESIGNFTLLGGVCRRRSGFEVCMLNQRASIEAGDLGSDASISPPRTAYAHCLLNGLQTLTFHSMAWFG